MRHFLAIVTAFTLGSTLAALHYERKQDGTEHAYHEGYDDGFRSGQAEERNAQERYSVVYEDMTHRVEEDDPAWDCKTMGNRQCGPGFAH